MHDECTHPEVSKGACLAIFRVFKTYSNPAGTIVLPAGPKVALRESPTEDDGASTYMIRCAIQLEFHTFSK